MLIAIASAIALAVVILLSIFENRSRADVLESAQWVSHTLEVQRALGRIRTLVTDAETGQRGYLLTMDESYLAPNEQAIAVLPGALAELRQLVEDNPRQLARLGQLDQLLTRKMAELRETVTIARSGDRDRSMQLVFDGGGDQLMSDVRTLIQTAIDDEEHLLQDRQQRLVGSIRWRTIAMRTLIGGLAIGLLGIAALLIRLGRVRDMITVCSWSKTVQHEGEWLSYEEYMRRRFKVDITHGMSPAEYAKLLGEVPGQTRGI